MDNHYIQMRKHNWNIKEIIPTPVYVMLMISYTLISARNFIAFSLIFSSFQLSCRIGFLAKLKELEAHEHGADRAWLSIHLFRC